MNIEQVSGGRMVVHFTDLVPPDPISHLTIGKMYEVALYISRKLGGKKYTSSSFKGGIAFKTSDEEKLRKDITELMKDAREILYFKKSSYTKWDVVLICKFFHSYHYRRTKEGWDIQGWGTPFTLLLQATEEHNQKLNEV